MGDEEEKHEVMEKTGRAERRDESTEKETRRDAWDSVHGKQQLTERTVHTYVYGQQRKVPRGKSVKSNKTGNDIKEICDPNAIVAIEASEASEATEATEATSRLLRRTCAVDKITWQMAVINIWTARA